MLYTVTVDDVRSTPSTDVAPGVTTVQSDMAGVVWQVYSGTRRERLQDSYTAHIGNSGRQLTRRDTQLVENGLMQAWLNITGTI